MFDCSKHHAGFKHLTLTLTLKMTNLMQDALKALKESFSISNKPSSLVSKSSQSVITGSNSAHDVFDAGNTRFEHHLLVIFSNAGWLQGTSSLNQAAHQRVVLSLSTPGRQCPLPVSVYSIAASFS